MKPANILDIARSRDLCLSYRCSVCGYTVIRFCTVHSLVRTGYEFAAAKARAHAEETANKQMDALVADVASCREKPHSLGKLCPDTKLNPWLGITEYEIDSKTRAMTRIVGLTGVCPCCGNQEPWQKVGAQSGLRTLPPESFPTVFDNPERAELDVLLKLQSVQEENEAIRRDPERLAAAREEAARLLAERSAALSGLQDQEIQQQISSLEARKTQLEGDLRAAGLMAFKAKKEISAKIAEVSEQIDELRKQDKANKNALNRTLRKDDHELERYAVLFAPTAAKLEQCWSNEAKVLRLYAAEQD